MAVLNRWPRRAVRDPHIAALVCLQPAEYLGTAARDAGCAARIVPRADPKKDEERVTEWRRAKKSFWKRCGAIGQRPRHCRNLTKRGRRTPIRAQRLSRCSKPSAAKQSSVAMRPT